MTITVAPNTAKVLTAFSLRGTGIGGVVTTGIGTINETGKTIVVNMPYGTNVSSLVATYVTAGINVSVGTTAQTSGTTANNFTAPVTYIVTAANGTKANYTVIVTVASGVVIQGGLTWTPTNDAPGGATYYTQFPGQHFYTWQEANFYCSTTAIQGLTGWRLPTIYELAGLVGETVTSLNTYGNASTTGTFNNSALANAGGWSLGGTWSSTPDTAGHHYYVGLHNGSGGWQYDTLNYYVTCVR